jgi:magnesium and cobalt transporter
MRVNELLLKFQTDKVQIAIIIDQHAKTLGLATLEDLIEEIVGEIEEAHGKNSHAAHK